MLLASRPPERHRKEGIRSEAQGRMSGCPFSLVTFLLGKQQESDSPGGETQTIRQFGNQLGNASGAHGAPYESAPNE
jgi:hypothetical protein